MSQLSAMDLLWCVRRLPRALVALCKANPSRLVIAGGYIRSRITNEPVNDIDCFVASVADGASMALAYAEGDEKRVHKTQNALTIKASRPTVQFITRWTYTDPVALLDSFDFTIACAAMWWSGSAWVSMTHPDYYADLAARRLRYTSPQRNEDAGGSMLRVLKFYQRGYRIPIDSLGAVVARLTMGVEQVSRSIDEAQLAKVVTGLLHEVDPNLDPDHIAHLPSEIGTLTAEDNF